MHLITTPLHFFFPPRQSPDACLTWEGSPFQGREAIAGKLVVSIVPHMADVDQNPQERKE